jgi:hypothetical protein
VLTPGALRDLEVNDSPPTVGSVCPLTNLYLVILDSFRCAAKDLARYRLESESMWLRREGDSEDPHTWHLVRTIRYVSFRSIYDPGLQGIKLLAVSFDDGTPEMVLNQTDQVEFSVPRHARLPES